MLPIPALFRSLFSQNYKNYVTEQAFTSALAKYKNWCNSLPPAQTNRLNHRLYFLQLLEEESRDTSLKTNEGIANILLDGTGIRSVGERFERMSQAGKMETWTVLWRRIGSRYGVELGFKTEDGKCLSGEFFD